MTEQNTNVNTPTQLESALQSAESIMQFPLLFPIKVMGLASEHFVNLVEDLARLHFTDFNSQLTKVEYSKTGKYMSVTITVNAQSKDQLDSVYMAFTSNPEVKIVL